MLDNLFSSPQPIHCEDACDSNDDGLIDIADAISLLNGLFQSQPLPMPWMVCGPDVTPSNLTCVSTSHCP